jgi:hypothetical protein
VTVRSLETRVGKLEALRRRPNELLVVWRRPGGNVAEALGGTSFAKGDKVICAEWFEDDSPLPEPRWYRDQLNSSMPPAEYEQLERTIDRIAERAEAARDEAGFAPFPTFNEERMKQMSDAELVHALLGVQT